MQLLLYTILKTAFILRGINSTRFWKHSAKIFVPIANHITQLLQICWLHIHDANLRLHHIPKVLVEIEIW